MNKAKMHLNFCMLICRVHAQVGRYVLHEHPSGATSLQKVAARRLASQETVITAMLYMCAFGMKAADNKMGRICQ